MALSGLLHVFVFGVQSFALYYDSTYVRKHLPHSYGGKWKYMTYWNMILQCIYFGVCVVGDACDRVAGDGTRGLPVVARKVRAFRDAMYSTIAFPLGLIVVLLFWGIYGIDRELVYPKVLDGIIPQWLNHVMHTTPVLFLSLEQSVVYHAYPRRAQGLLITLIFASIYLIWLLWVKYAADLWAYPIFDVLTPVQTGAFLLCASLAFLATYLCGEVLHGATWPPAGTHPVPAPHNGHAAEDTSRDERGAGARRRSPRHTIKSR